MKKIKVQIDGLHCQNCENACKNAIMGIKNVNSVDLSDSIATVEYDSFIDKEELVKVITDLNYETDLSKITE